MTQNTSANIRLPTDLLAAFRKKAKGTGHTLSQRLRLLIERDLEESHATMSRDEVIRIVEEVLESKGIGSK